MSFSANSKPKRRPSSKEQDRADALSGALLDCILLGLLACSMTLMITLLLAIDHVLSLKTTLIFTIGPALIIYVTLYWLTRPDSNYVIKEMRKRR